MLGASVILAPAHPLVLPHIAESFRWFGQVHADWLKGLGTNAECVSAAELAFDRALAWSCFGNLSHWEVEVEGSKIVALSQARTRNGVLLSSAASLPTLVAAGLIQVKVVTAEFGIVCIELARLERRLRTHKR